MGKTLFSSPLVACCRLKLTTLARKETTQRNRIKEETKKPASNNHEKEGTKTHQQKQLTQA